MPTREVSAMLYAPLGGGVEAVVVAGRQIDDGVVQPVPWFHPQPFLVLLVRQVVDVLAMSSSLPGWPQETPE